MSDPSLSRFNLTLSGQPDAETTLLFVNGLGTDQSVWHQVTPAFQDDYRLILFDNVGSVESSQDAFRSRLSRYLNVSGYAEDLLEIGSALKLSRNTVVIGHSLGAMAALLASIQRPAQFSRLVLLGMSPRYANIEGYEGGFSQADIRETYTQLTNDYASWTKAVSAAAMGNPHRPHLARSFAETIARVPRDLMLTVLCSVLQMDHRAALSDVSVPVLLLQSQNDFFVPLGVAQYLQTNIRNSRLTMIDAAGHLPHVSTPQAVVGAIRDFLSDTPETSD